jgi:ketopantoate reductase
MSLIARKPHIYAIRHNGFILDGPFGKRIIEIKAAEKLDFKQDLVLRTVKTQDVEFSIKEIKRFISDVPITVPGSSWIT